jgi:hypothetical protein
MSPPRDLPFGVRGARHIGLWNGMCLMNQFAKVDAPNTVWGRVVGVADESKNFRKHQKHAAVNRTIRRIRSKRSRSIRGPVGVGKKNFLP